MTIKKIMITTTLMISTLFLTACGSDEGEKFVGIWKDPEVKVYNKVDGTINSKTTTFYVIEKSGSDYTIHDSRIFAYAKDNFKPIKTSGEIPQVVSFKDGKLIFSGTFFGNQRYISYIDENTLMLNDQKKLIRVNEVK